MLGPHLVFQNGLGVRVLQPPSLGSNFDYDRSSGCLISYFTAGEMALASKWPVSAVERDIFEIGATRPKETEQ